MISNYLYNDHMTHTHAHCSSLCEHKEELYCCWYIYEQEEHKEGKIVISKFNKLKNHWSNPTVLTQQSGSFGNPVLYSNGDDLELFYSKIYNYWNDSEIFHLTIIDTVSYKTSPSSRIELPKGTMLRHRPQLVNQKTYIPAYDEKSMTTKIYSYSDDPTRWDLHAQIEGEFIQGDLTIFNNKEWQLFLRAAGDNKHIYRILSSDGGKSWDKPIQTKLPCPLSGIAARPISNSEILCCYNDTFEHKRTPISLNLSTNRGVSFYPKSLTIENTNIELSYPSLLIDSTNEIHITYTHGRKKIKHIRIESDEVKRELEKINE